MEEVGKGLGSHAEKWAVGSEASSLWEARNLSFASFVLKLVASFGEEE